MSRGTENRRSFRMFESVHLMYDIISDRDFHEGRARRKMRLGAASGLRSTILDVDARLAEKLYLLRSEAGTIADCISLLNEKISAVIEHLPEMREAKTSLAKQDPQTCELGADGMLFGTKKEIPPGTRMALRFLLASTHRYIETFCIAVRQTEPPDEDDARFRYAVVVEFVDMDSPQKELIIQHLFNRESETLRARRQHLEV